MWCFFENHEIPYNLRCGSVVKFPGTNTTIYGINSLNFRGAMLCNIIPKNIYNFLRRYQDLRESWEHSWYVAIVLHAVFSITG